MSFVVTISMGTVTLRPVPAALGYRMEIGPDQLDFGEGRQVRNGDFAFAAWLRQETERQLGIRQGGKTA